MKFDIKKPWVLFILPILMICTYFLFLYNVNFSINGFHYELLISDVLIMITSTTIFYTIIHLLFFKIIRNRFFLFFFELVIFAGYSRSFPISYIIFMILLMIFLIQYRKEPPQKVTLFCELFCTMILLMATFMFGYNLIASIYNNILFLKRDHHYTKIYDVKTEEGLQQPNIYWLHMDGMPNLDLIRKYYDRDLDEYQQKLEAMNFMVNTDASFAGGQHTMSALNALYNPKYYDDFFKDYLDEYEKCRIDSCITKESTSMKDMIYIRHNNELLQGLKKQNYTTISIAEFVQYSSFDTDYVYDLWNIEKDYKIKYFKNNYTQEQLYHQILKAHLQNFSGIPFHSDLAQKEMTPTFNNAKYPWIKRIMFSLEDTYEKNLNDPKFYFMDITLVHQHWNYDENGKLIRQKNDNPADFDKTYVYTLRVLMEILSYIQEKDPNAIVIVQGDHGMHTLPENTLKQYYHIKKNQINAFRDATFSAIYIPEQYKNGDEEYLENPLNISRYLVNNFVGENYEYLK